MAFLRSRREDYQGPIGVTGEAESGGHDAAGLRILVVEDYADCAQSTAMLLRMWGHKVEMAKDGPTAWALAQSHCPDVVLLDIALPGMTGWELAKRIKARAAERRPWVIAVSGYDREVDRRQSAESGIDLHLTKPVDPQELERILKEIAGNDFRARQNTAASSEVETNHGQTIDQNRCRSAE